METPVALDVTRLATEFVAHTVDEAMGSWLGATSAGIIEYDFFEKAVPFAYAKTVWPLARLPAE